MTATILNNPLKTSIINSNANKQDRKEKATFIKNTAPSDKIVRHLKANNVPMSYNNRFLRSKNRSLYYKTVKQDYIKILSHEEIEEVYQLYLETNIHDIEKREKYKKSLNGLSANFVSMVYRTFSYTKAFITHCVKNTFATIFRGSERENDNYNMHVLAKVSSGLIGFRGPKKSTVFARKGVIKEAGNILASKMTSLLDVIFTSKVSRWNRKSVRDLCPSLSYVLNIFINYKRPHGYTKHKNKRRV
jgi:hypothetical protein